MSAALRIVIAQIDLTVGAIEENADKIVLFTHRAQEQYAADVVLFPELTLTGYPPEDLLLRPGFVRRAQSALQAIIERVVETTVVVGYPQATATGLFNAAAVIQRGQVVATYHKQQLPNYGVFDEKRYFTAGSRPALFKVNGIPLAVTICEDLWHPGCATQAQAAGAAAILNLNASPFHSGKERLRETVIRARVSEAALPIVYANLVGGQDELVFDGGSFVMAADGHITQRAARYVEGLFPVDFVWSAAGELQPLPADQAPPLTTEAAVYQALVLGVRDYVLKNGFKGVVIGLSGGVDSALTLAIAVDALGADQVEAVMMPSRYTADMSLEDAKLEADILGVEYHLISIEHPFEVFLTLLQDEFLHGTTGVAQENIQARCRGLMLMAISNKKGKMVLTTGNKSEMSVGYATLYGDMAGGFAPLKDVPKMLVYRLCRYRNAIAEVIPERVLTRPPSAELAPDQKDVDSLPPYEILDPILELYIEQDLEPDEIVARGYGAEIVERVVRMVNRNEYKRRQAPPGVRITTRAFGRDRRYPITSGYKV